MFLKLYGTRWTVALDFRDFKEAAIKGSLDELIRSTFKISEVKEVSIRTLGCAAKSADDHLKMVKDAQSGQTLTVTIGSGGPLRGGS